MYRHPPLRTVMSSGRRSSPMHYRERHARFRCPVSQYACHTNIISRRAYSSTYSPALPIWTNRKTSARPHTVVIDDKRPSRTSLMSRIVAKSFMGWELLATSNGDDGETRSISHRQHLRLSEFNLRDGQNDNMVGKESLVI